MPSNKFEARWTGTFPAPYLGEWKVYKNKKEITQFLPTDLRTIPAYTYGEYAVWETNPYAEVQQFATDGYKMPEWIHKNMYWLPLMCDNDEDYALVYLAFHANDFRTTQYI